MEFYVIPPNENLELMNKGDRFFCLSQQYSKSDEYRKFFKQKVKEGAWVTLDNGAGDHDTVSKGALLDIARDLQPSELIPLDILFDGKATLENLEWTIDQTEDDPLLRDIEIFACPQGINKREWLDTYIEMLWNDRVSTIGMSKLAIPFVISGSSGGDKNIARDRNTMFQFLRSRKLIRKSLHFLGAGEPWEFEMYKDSPFCRSTDSCFSVWSGMNGIRFSDEDYERIPTPKEYFDLSIADHMIPVIEDNINYIKNILK